MAYVISDDCITCGTCEGECPVGAISMVLITIKSIRMLARNVVPAQVFVRLKRSNRLNLIIKQNKKRFEFQTAFYFITSSIGTSIKSVGITSSRN